MPSRCGMCGDPKGGGMHAQGGKFATGTIARNYTAGSVITIGLLISVNHYGKMKFELCNLDSGNGKGKNCN